MKTETFTREDLTYTIELRGLVVNAYVMDRKGNIENLDTFTCADEEEAERGFKNRVYFYR